MAERNLRAVWFALFATTGLIVGGFVIGYGVALLGNPISVAGSARAPLPTLAASWPGTNSATAVESNAGETFAGGARAGVGAPLADDPTAAEKATATPVAVATGQAGPAPTSTVPVPASGSTPTGVALPAERVAGNGLVVSLERVDVNSAQGGVELSLDLRNGSEQGISFSFLPESDLSLTDGQGRRYVLRWSEFDGTVSVASGEKVRLVRAFFGGVPADGTNYLLVRVGHPPQLGTSSWWVPISR